VRAMTFLPQVAEKRIWANVRVRDCCTLFFIGFVKKACISEFAAGIADSFFADPGKFTHTSAVLGVLFYAVQIYCDFSGYSDMAIATARLLGYELTPNFDFPYFSRSITEFWRRWHISLSTWLRDYLYISLGGNRGSKLFTYRNLLLTMLLGGLWHGASWTFVIWGGMHGVALIFHREWERLTANAGAAFKTIIAWLAVPLTFYWVCLTWIFFRAAPVIDEKTGAVKASGLEVADRVIHTFMFSGKQGKSEFGWIAVVVLVALAVIHWLNSRRVFSAWWQRLPDWAAAGLLGIGTELAILFVPAKYKAFIYFQF
jgi:alginate O-acetyltransferase complex protein AlgI